MPEPSKEFAYLENLQPKKPAKTETEFKIKTTQKNIESKERQMERGNEAARRAMEAQLKILADKVEELKRERERLGKEDGIAHA